MSASSSGSTSPLPENSQKSDAISEQATPSHNTLSSPSTLPMFLKPHILSPSTTTPKSSKGKSARVSTRSEIVAQIEEKERKKKQAVEEKEQSSEKEKRKRSNDRKS